MHKRGPGRRARDRRELARRSKAIAELKAAGLRGDEIGYVLWERAFRVRPVVTPESITPKQFQILCLKRQGFSSLEITEALDMFQQGVSQKVIALEAQFGTNVFVPDEPLYDFGLAQELTGVPNSTIRWQCRHGLIPCRFNGVAWILRQEGLRALMAYAERRDC